MEKILISSICDCTIFFWFNRKCGLRSFYGLRMLASYIGMVFLTDILNTCDINVTIWRIIINIIFYFGMFCFNYRCLSIGQAIVRNLVFIGCVILGEMTTAIVLMISAQEGDAERLLNSTFFWGVSLIVSKCCEVIFLNLIDRVILEKKLEYQSVIGHFIITGILLVYLLFCVYCSGVERYITMLSHSVRSEGIYITIDPEVYTIFDTVFIVNILFAVVIFVGNIIVVSVINKNKTQEKEIQMLTEKATIQIQYYEEINEYKKQMQRIYHDLKNHTLIAESLTDQNMADKYLESLDEYFDSMMVKENTGNEILDILVQKKAEECRKKEIDFQSKIDFSKGDFINLVDVSIIFGNILDNAIEACERIEDREKEIKMLVGTYEEFIFIKCDNPVDKIVTSNKRLISLKKDKKRHGIGMGSLNNSIEKYEGTLSYKIEDGRFLLNILIPIKQ